MPTAEEIARSKLESEAAKLHAEAQKAALDVEKARIELAEMAVPDITGIERGSLTASEGKPMLASPLASRALAKAAQKVADAACAKATTVIRVTTDRDLEASSAAYIEVQNGLETLKNQAEQALAPLPPPASAGSPSGPVWYLGPATGVAVATAAKSILVPALSLLSAKRTISTQELSGDDRLAAIAVAGAIKAVTDSRTVYLDSARPILSSDSAVTSLRDDVAAKREELRAYKTELETREDQAAVTRTAVIEKLVAAIDAYLVALATVPSGATRSAWTSALIQERSTAEGNDVLVVQAISGSALQLLDDRPLWWKDRFSTYASMGVAFILVSGATGEVKLAGSRTATSMMQGKIGADLTDQSVRDLTV